jgi:anti-sigma regulatory factor (Ser/Thr protein kinase)
MSIRSAELLRRRLRCNASAPHLAREALGALGVIEPVRDDVLLVASELVTNAVLHSGCTPGEELALVAKLIPGGLEIAVTDPGRSDTTPTPRPSYAGPGGVGLRIVEALARRWGTERRHGRRVWAELALQSQTAARE